MLCGGRLSMRERSISAAQQPAVRQRVADALQRVLDTLIANLDAKTKTYKNKVNLQCLIQLTVTHELSAGAPAGLPTPVLACVLPGMLPHASRSCCSQPSPSGRNCMSKLIASRVGHLELYAPCLTGRFCQHTFLIGFTEQYLACVMVYCGGLSGER